jgi:hypothetical protein
LRCVCLKGDWKKRLREGIGVDDDVAVDVDTIVNFEGRRNEKRELSGQTYIHDKILPRGSLMSQ